MLNQNLTHLIGTMVIWVRNAKETTSLTDNDLFRQTVKIVYSSRSES